MIQQGEAVRRMYPEYIGDANPYEFLAAADLAKGDKKAAAAVLTDYEKIGGEDPVNPEEAGLAGGRVGPAERGCCDAGPHQLYLPGP